MAKRNFSLDKGFSLLKRIKNRKNKSKKKINFQGHRKERPQPLNANRRRRRNKTKLVVVNKWLYNAFCARRRQSSKDELNLPGKKLKELRNDKNKRKLDLIG